VGTARGLHATANEDLALATNLKLRATGADLIAVQYARVIETRALLIRNAAKYLERDAELASPEGGNHTQRQAERWPGYRRDIVVNTVDMDAALDRLEAHFPLATRLLPDTDAEGFLRDFERELEQDREERLQRAIKRDQHPSLS
jgi:hypothetical protein